MKNVIPQETRDILSQYSILCNNIKKILCKKYKVKYILVLEIHTVSYPFCDNKCDDFRGIFQKYNKQGTDIITDYTISYNEYVDFIEHQKE